MDSIPDIVDLVLWLLATLSILTWTIMLMKAYGLLRTNLVNRRFLDRFEVLTHVRETQSAIGGSMGTLARLGIAGMEELQSQSHSQLDVKDRREMLRHALKQHAHLEQSRLESGLAVLASVGSTSPFIGLFGTVWGIMHALKNITASGSAGLDVVAGPIGEALIATAMGIAVAIPAVLAYNYFLRKVQLAATAMDHFSDRFLHLAIKSGWGSE